ncbi:MAG: tetratricopeptide repeat protein [Gemmatimonadetes bacterium]|jgi:tetratricopeptide (TPR) repeat protein|nr:tetratricopeptide repeat protein [Gemmatimonadota bacterium]MBT7863108.1 tetratricopeptide repeat protein [Gemmatimonadota bacterium]
MAKILQFPTDDSGEVASDRLDSLAGGVDEDDFDLDDVVTIEPDFDPEANAQSGPASAAAMSEPPATEQVRQPPKFGFTRVRRSRKKKEPEHQLDLFPPGKVLAFPQRLDPFEEGLLRDEEGQVDHARSHYEAAIAADDRVADASCNLGIIDYLSGNVEAAFDCFRTALKHDQRHWESHYNLANLYFDTGRYDPARVHYEMAAEIAPEFRNIFFNLGLALAMQGDYGAAIDALSSYRRLAPGEEGEAAEDLLAALRKTRQSAGPPDVD